MKHLNIVLMLLLPLISWGQTIELIELKAFPTAHGFGRYTTGGRGGSVYTVTNLNNTGAGSFKEGYLNTSGARTIVFNVSGNINYTGVMFNNNPDITIAGQTSPNGVAIYSTDGGNESRAGNMIWRHLKFRGTTIDRSNLRLNANSSNISDVIVDHCSFSWAGTTEMNFATTGSDPYGVQNMTLQYNIMGGVTRNILQNFRSTKGSYVRNLMSQVQMRGIRKGNAGTDLETDFHFEETNNILHGFADPPISVSLGAKFSALNNIRTPSDQVTVNGAINPSVVRGEDDGTGTPSNTYAYIEGNINQVPTGTEQTNLTTYMQVSPYETTDYLGAHVLPANELEDTLIPYLGSFWFDDKRDTQDALYISNLQSRTGALDYTGTLPTLSAGTYVDSNNNGMPDSFETEHGVSDQNATKLDWDFGDYNVKNTAGYTNLEMYLNWKAGDFQMMIDGIEVPDGSWVFLDNPDPEPQPGTGKGVNLNILLTLD